jgi:hypothetical protein
MSVGIVHLPLHPFRSVIDKAGDADEKQRQRLFRGDSIGRFDDTNFNSRSVCLIFETIPLVLIKVGQRDSIDDRSLSVSTRMLPVWAVLAPADHALLTDH